MASPSTLASGARLIASRLSLEEARVRVLMIYVGGTLGMRRNLHQPLQQGLANVGGEELAEVIADYGLAEGIGWKMLPLEDDGGRPMPPVDSSEVGPQHWVYLASMLERYYARFDGFVILHGTDTLAYTASALSFLLVNLAKPVVLTGSQLPIFELRSDARQNLLHALLIAGARAVGLPVVPEVCVCFGDVLLRGNRARKSSTSGWQGFHSPNYPPLGLLGESLRLYPERFCPAPPPDAAFYVGRVLEDQVLDLTLFPGIQAGQIESLLHRDKTDGALKGLVLRAYGAGNAPDDPALLDCLGRAVEQGQTILVVTQCHEGRVDLGRYASSRGLMQRGVASGFDLTPEAALTKLMWVLATERGSEVRVQLQLNQRGEQSYARQELLFYGGGEGEPGMYFETTARTAAPLPRQSLVRALLKVEVKQRVGPLQVYLNAHPLSPDPARCIARIEGDELCHMVDVTLGVKRFMVEDRPFHLLLVGEEAWSLSRVEMSLTTRA